MLKIILGKLSLRLNQVAKMFFFSQSEHLFTLFAAKFHRILCTIHRTEKFKPRNFETVIFKPVFLKKKLKEIIKRSFIASLFRVNLQLKKT